MVLHLMQSFFLAFVPAISLFFKIELATKIAWQAGGLEKQATAAGFGLAGLPIILVAMWGVRTKNEVPVRFYGYFLLFCFVVDLVVSVLDLVVYSPCGISPSQSKAGTSFSCGASRIVNSSSFGLMFFISMYLIFIIFSYAEELSLGAGPDLSDLVTKTGTRRKQPLVGDILTSMDNAEMYGTMKGVSGSTPIFGLGRHETTFPPGFASSGTYRQ